MLETLSRENFCQALSAGKRERSDQSTSNAQHGLSPRAEKVVADILRRLSIVASDQLSCEVKVLLGERPLQEHGVLSLGKEPLRVLLSIFDEPLELLVSQELSQELARAVLHQERGVVLGVSSAEIRTAVSFLAVSILSAQAQYASQRVFLSSVDTVSGDPLTSPFDSSKDARIELSVLFRESCFRLFVKFSPGLCMRLKYYARLCALPPSGKRAFAAEVYSAQLQLDAPVGSALSLLTLRPGALLNPKGFRLSLGSSGHRLSGAVEGGVFEVCDAAVLRLRCRV